jgi:hypothetical protein
MADIRIKDLTTTASTTAADDFFAADGATNGTRKLSAFSPSFGGNATVGGTLTVSGETFTLANSTGAGTGYGFAKISGLNGGYVDFFAANGTTRNGSVGAETGGDMYLGTRTNKPIYFQVNWSTAATLDATKLSIAATTASTTTSSGALVVGNGTSGGLGVGGNVTSLGFLLAGNGASKNANTDAGFYSTATGNTTLHVAGFSGGSQSADNLKVSLNGISEWLAVKASGQVACYATTASNNTSSGALVVSGGVGVAKSINAGESGSTHNFTGGDGGSGSTIFAIKDNAGANKVLVSGVGAVAIDGSLSITTSSNAFRITTAQTPASASATGTSGTICWDTSYIYVCTATNTWKRVAISTW